MAIGDKLNFSTYQRSKLFTQARVQNGHLYGELKLKLTDASTGESAESATPFAFYSTADVAGLKNEAILRVAPLPNAQDAETTKMVHVEFAEPDLPWRYTPELNSDKLPPWLVLLVGPSEELVIENGIILRVSHNVLKEHNLDDSYLWAHVQNDISRLLSPFPLQKQHEYTAALVPAIRATGGQMWRDGALMPGVVLPSFYTWRFRTGEEGDFVTLAAALHKGKASDLGITDLSYVREVTAVDVTLKGRGAITSLQLPHDNAEHVAFARDDLDQLLGELEEDASEPKRQMLGPPPYGRPWQPDPEQSVWGRTLNRDPRFRGIAGLGSRLGIEAQGQLMDAAVEQAGALDDASQRIRWAAFGLLAAGQLWHRRLPDDANRQLTVFGPAMGRMQAAGGRSVLERITTGESPLPPALFSSAAMRLLRKGTARGRHTAGIDRAAVMDAANKQLSPPEKIPDGLPHADLVTDALGLPPLEKLLGMEEIPSELNEILHSIGEKFAGQPNEPHIRTDLIHLLYEYGIRCSERILNALNAMANAGLAVLEADIIIDIVRRFCFSQGYDREKVNGDFLVESTPARPAGRFRPVNLSKLADAVRGAIDPTADRPPAWRRIAATIEGLDPSSLSPPELPLGLDFPTWQLLNKYASEWLLPGRGLIEKDSIVALQTNPSFIDAFMVGINTQFMREMRWRNLAIDRTFTPLRMFWGYFNYATGRREADIEPLAKWAERTDTDLGDLSHQTIKPGADKGKQDLVIAFRTDLFRRYPSTLVYLVKKPPDGTPEAKLDELLKKPPQLEHSSEDRDLRQYFGPIFMAELEPDLHCFMFDIEPSKLDKYWLVLDEPPSELRFRIAKNGEPNCTDTPNSAKFAQCHIDKPTRVAIDGAYLEQQG